MVKKAPRPGTLYFWPTDHDGCPKTFHVNQRPSGPDNRHG